MQCLSPVVMDTALSRVHVTSIVMYVAYCFRSVRLCLSACVSVRLLIVSILWFIYKVKCSNLMCIFLRPRNFKGHPSDRINIQRRVKFDLTQWSQMTLTGIMWFCFTNNVSHLCLQEPPGFLSGLQKFDTRHKDLAGLSFGKLSLYPTKEIICIWYL